MGQELGTLQKLEGCKKQGNILGEIKNILHNFSKAFIKRFLFIIILAVGFKKVADMKFLFGQPTKEIWEIEKIKLK